MIVIAVTLGLRFWHAVWAPGRVLHRALYYRGSYSGASLGYQIGAILGGALAPTIAVLLWNELGIFYVSVYILIAAILTLLSLSALEETKGRTL